MGIFEAIQFECEHIGRTRRDDNWECDQWDCSIIYEGNTYEFPYYMGVGLNGQAPEKLDVLQALVDDTRAGDMSFDEFCNEFGYNNDSIKHLKIYESCKETSKEMYRLLSGEFEELEGEIREIMEEESA